jgi:hypothetical protein
MKKAELRPKVLKSLAARLQVSLEEAATMRAEEQANAAPALGPTARKGRGGTAIVRKKGMGEQAPHFRPPKGRAGGGKQGVAASIRKQRIRRKEVLRKNLDSEFKLRLPLLRTILNCDGTNK